LKRLTLSLLVCSLVLAGAVQSGCGGDDPGPVDPNQVLNRAFDDVEAGTAPEAEAEVAVTSLGFEDRPLRTRILEVDAASYASIREAIASPEKGLRSVVTGIESEGREEIDGVETEHVTGRLDVDRLVALLTKASGEGADLDENGTELPGLGDLERLRDTLVEGRFDFYAEAGSGAFERLDLTLSLDDRKNALPPTRIRFSLTESDPTEESS